MARIKPVTSPSGSMSSSSSWDMVTPSSVSVQPSESEYPWDQGEESETEAQNAEQWADFDNTVRLLPTSGTPTPSGGGAWVPLPTESPVAPVASAGQEGREEDELVDMLEKLKVRIQLATSSTAPNHDFGSLPDRTRPGAVLTSESTSSSLAQQPVPAHQNDQDTNTLNETLRQQISELYELVDKSLARPSAIAAQPDITTQQPKEPPQLEKKSARKKRVRSKASKTAKAATADKANESIVTETVPSPAQKVTSREQAEVAHDEGGASQKSAPRFFTDASLGSYQELCAVLGLPNDLPSKNQCRKALREKHVNLVDLRNSPHTVKFFPSRSTLVRYTKKGKGFRISELPSDVPVRALLFRHY